MPRRGHLWCACQTTYALHTLDFTQPALSQRTQRTHSLGVVVPLRDHTPPIAVPHAVAAAGQKHPSPSARGAILSLKERAPSFFSPALLREPATLSSYIPDGEQVTDTALFGKGACPEGPEPSRSGVQR